MGAGRVSLFWQLPIPGPPGMQGRGQAGAPGSTGPVWPVALRRNYFRPATSVQDRGDSIIDFPIKVQFIVSKRSFLAIPHQWAPRPSGEWTASQLTSSLWAATETAALRWTLSSRPTPGKVCPSACKCTGVLAWAGLGQAGEAWAGPAEMLAKS